jgi:2-keto-4-pentenoate hydratase
MKPPNRPWEDPRIKAGMTAQLAQRRSRIAAGERPLGWKVGFGAPAAMEKFRLSAPLFGYLMQGALLPTGATASVKGWTQPVAEPEIGARLGADLSPGSDAAAGRAAIASLTPTIELADLEFSATDADVEKVLVRNIFQRHVVLSEKNRTGGDTSGLSTHIYRRGKLAAETATPEAITGRVVDVVVQLADLLGAFGERLRAGDLVICGSTVPPPFIEADETEFSYTLAPIGDVSVRFTR